jgi:hypothetical protein
MLGKALAASFILHKIELVFYGVSKKEYVIQHIPPGCIIHWKAIIITRSWINHKIEVTMLWNLIRVNQHPLMHHEGWMLFYIGNIDLLYSYSIVNHICTNHPYGS